jgi:hypothetical protein
LKKVNGTAIALTLKALGATAARLLCIENHRIFVSLFAIKMLLTHPYTDDLGFEELKRELQRMRRVWFIFYLFIGFRRKTVREFKATFEHHFTQVEEILKADCKSLPRKVLLESADKARDVLMQFTNIYGRLENMKFLKSAELKKTADKCLNGFYELERHLRREAYTDSDTIPEDGELMKFNALLSQKLPHYLNEI